MKRLARPWQLVIAVIAVGLGFLANESSAAAGAVAIEPKEVELFEGESQVFVVSGATGAVDCKGTDNVTLTSVREDVNRSLTVVTIYATPYGGKVQTKGGLSCNDGEKSAEATILVSPSSNRREANLRLSMGTKFRLCGRLSAPTASAKSWKLSGCAELFDYVASLQCGNGELDPGEACEVEKGCESGRVCSATCDECIEAPPTPIPTPTVKPTPTVVASQTPSPTDGVDLSDCQIAPDGGKFVTWFPGTSPGYAFGYDRISIRPGEKQTYCINVEDDRRRMAISLIDRTGIAQCFSHRAIFYPPIGSGLPTYATGEAVPVGGWWGSSLEGGWSNMSKATWYQPNWLAPKGVWKVTLQLRSDLDPSCGVFQLFAG